jgi:hypothetical protein
MFMHDHPPEQTHRVALILLLLVTAAGRSAPVLAAQYVLEKGNGEAVCEQLGKDPRVTWTGCPFPMTKDLLDLQAPEWILDNDAPMPSPSNLNLYSEISRYLWERDVNPVRYASYNTWPTWTGSAQQMRSAFETYRRQRVVYYSEPSVVTAYANLDIDNDGQSEPVYRDNHNCRFGGVSNTLVVFNSDFSSIDRVKTERILVHPRRRADTPYFRPLPRGQKGALANGRPLDFASVPDLAQDMHYGVFIYQGRTFVTVSGLRTEGGAYGDGKLHVYLHDPQGDREVCSFGFR